MSQTSTTPQPETSKHALHAIQYDMAWEDKQTNHARLETIFETQLKPEPESLVLLPEMFDVGFSMNVDRTAEEVTDNASEKWCAQMARRYRIYLQGASVHKPKDSTAGKVDATNNAVVFNPEGELVCRYAKIFPFSGGREHEAFIGGESIHTFTWHDLTVCPFICYDLRFPEIWRLAAIDLNVQLFTIGASWPAARQHHWITLLHARAIENQAYVAAVNRCGSDPFLNYLGGSRILNPKGEVMASCDENRTAIISTNQIDALTVESWRHTFPALKDAKRQYLGDIRR